MVHAQASHPEPTCIVHAPTSTAFRHGTVLLGILVLLLAWLVPAAPAAAQLFNSSQRVDVRAVPSRSTVAPGDQLVVAVVFDHDEGWHVHTHDPQPPQAIIDSGLRIIKTEIRVAESTAADASPLRPHVGFVQWPEAHGIEVAWAGAPVEYAVYEGEAVAYLPVTVADDAAPGSATLDLTVVYQACDDQSCLAPATERFSVDVEIVSLADAAAAVDGGQGDASSDADAALFAGFSPDVWQVIQSGAQPAMVVPFDLFGWQFSLDIAGPVGLSLLLLVTAVGGLLLNLTPCVLPVIPIKIMGLSHMAGSRARCLALGLIMAGGVVAFWLALGGAIAATAALIPRGEAGGITATNQLFQYPAFTITVGLIIAVMAIGMLGLFTVQLPRFIYKLNPTHDSVHGSFGFGVMTAVLSTPCTAPFMGAAAAGAVTQRPGIALAVFAAIGVGMALPYVVLAAFPKLVEWMPRTGPASELIKQVMGLLMLAAAAYFVGTGLSGWLNTPPDPASRSYWWAVGLAAVAAGAWLVYRTLRITPSFARRGVFVSLGVLLVLAGAHVGYRFTQRGPINWVYYTPERFEQQLNAGNVVVLEFTAEWCLNCKALEQAVLFDERIVDLLGSERVTPMKVDLTGNNTAGNAKLSELDRLTIPLLVVFAPDGSAVFKGDYYTVEQVLAAVGAAGE